MSSGDTSVEALAMAGEIIVWLLGERVTGEHPMFAIGVFSDVERAKLAAAAEAGIDYAPRWERATIDEGTEAYRAGIFMPYKQELIPIEFFIIPFVLNRAEAGTELLHVPRVFPGTN